MGEGRRKGQGEGHAGAAEAVTRNPGPLACIVEARSPGVGWLPAPGVGHGIPAKQGA